MHSDSGPQTRRRVCLAVATLVGAVLLGLGLFILWPEPPEPVFEGKRLSQWLEQLDYNLPTFQHGSTQAANTAIKKIGTNSVPLLIEMMQTRDTKLRTFVVRHLSSMKMVKTRFRPAAEHLQWRGALGISIVGSKDPKAVKELIDLLDSSTPWVKGRAALTLGDVGQEATGSVPDLIRALRDPSADVRHCVCIALSQMGSGAKAAVPKLLELLNDSDEQTKNLAFSALLALAEDRAQLIPFLSKRLRSWKPDVRGATLALLGAMGAQGQPASPNVKELLQDPDRFVRHAATNALRLITEPGYKQTLKSDAVTGFILENVPVQQAIRFYQDLCGVSVEASQVKNPVPVTIKFWGRMSRGEAVQFVEQEIESQARLSLRKDSNGQVTVTVQP